MNVVMTWFNKNSRAPKGADWKHCAHVFRKSKNLLLLLSLSNLPERGWSRWQLRLAVLEKKEHTARHEPDILTKKAMGIDIPLDHTLNPPIDSFCSRRANHHKVCSRVLEANYGKHEENTHTPTQRPTPLPPGRTGKWESSCHPHSPEWMGHKKPKLVGATSMVFRSGSLKSKTELRK